MKGDAVRTGIIGLGRSGAALHGETLKNHPGYVICAVADSESKRLEKAASDWGCRTYGDYRELLKNADVELVVVATPSHTHCSMAVDALKARKSVLVEKPMAVSVTEADRMIQAAKESGGLLSVFQCRRFDADFLKVQEIIKRGLLGRIHYIRRGVYGFSRRMDWQCLKKYGGGMLNNWGAHLIDQAMVLLDFEAEKVFSDARLTVSAGDAEDQVKVILKGKSILFDIDIASCCSLGQPEWLVMGTLGTLMITGNSLQLKYCDAEKLAPLPAAGDILPAAGAGYSSEEITWKEEGEKISGENCFKLFYDHLHSTLRKGAALAVKPEEARRVLQIIESCRKH